MAYIKNLRWSKHSSKPFDGPAVDGDTPGIGYMDLALQVAQKVHKYENHDLKKAANVLKATKRQVYITHANRCVTEMLHRRTTP